VDSASSPLSSAPSESANTQDSDSAQSLSVAVKAEAGPPSQVLLAPSAQYADAASQTTPLADPIERALVKKTAELETTRGKIMEQQDYISTLKTRLSSAKKEREVIRQSTRAAAHHRDDLVMQRNIRVENSVLKEQIENMRRQRQSVASIEADSLGPSDKTIREEFELINVGVKDACSSVDAGIPNPADAVAGVEGTGSVVESWARRLARCSLGQLVTSALDSGTSDFDIIRSVTAVGLCSLVFESQFPNFTARESPLLDQYRKHVLIRGTKTECPECPWEGWPF